MVQLIPSSTPDSSTLTQNSDNVTVFPISSIQSALDTITGITVSTRAMPTTTVPAENKSQNVKVNIPKPTPSSSVPKAVEDYATANNTATRQDLNNLLS
jgi:hypothetical protein